MTLEIGIVLAIIVITIYLFVTEKFGIDIISVAVMVALMATGILTPQEGFAGFTNSATITVACMFVVSSAIFKSGALGNIGNILKALGKRNYLLTMVFLMLFSGLLSAFMNDTAVVAILMPVVLSVSRQTGINPSRLLMPLSFGALLGGICTLIGTSTNILVSGIAEQQGLNPIGMFEMAPMGLCFLGVGILYMLTIGKSLLPDRKQKEDLAEEFGMGKYLTQIVLLPHAKSVGKTIMNSPLVKNIELEILQVIRNKISMEPFPGLVLEANDVLSVSCDIQKLKILMDREGIQFTAGKTVNRELLTPGKIILAEAMVKVNSSLENRTLQEYKFRSRFNGATVLAIRHRNEILHEKTGRTILKSGDVLLIATNSDQMAALKNSDDLLIISEAVHQPFNLVKTASIVGIVAALVIVAALGIIPIMLSATIGVLALVAMKFITTEDSYKAVDWKVVFMLAGMLSLGTALEKTGAAALLANGIVKFIGPFGPQIVLSAFFGLTFLFTNFMSNNATAALLTPIAIVTAAGMGVDSRPFILAVAFAASLSFMTPMSYQTNAMIYIPGNYKFKDYVRVGTPLNIIFWIMAAFLIPYFYPF